MWLARSLMTGVLLPLCLLSTARSVAAQEEVARDVKRSVDSFTGDTIWETKYGRLDDPHGCRRVSLAIIWKFARGPSGRSEWLTYEWAEIPDPFHSAGFLGVVRTALNVDGKIIEGKDDPLAHRLGFGHGLLDSPGEKKESGAFLYPDSTFRLIAGAKVAKIRLLGTEATCDGTVEENMKERLKTLLDLVEPPADSAGTH